MRQPLPVVRQLHGPSLIPQLFAVALLSGAAWLVLPTSKKSLAILLGSVAYLVYCRAMRFLFVRDHILGMRAYRCGEFRGAIAHYEACYRFFSAHRRLDAWRSLLFGVSSYNPYRVIALANMAYCHAQLGEKSRAIELYEQVLQEVPEHPLARMTLNLLRDAAPSGGAA